MKLTLSLLLAAAVFIPALASDKNSPKEEEEVTHYKVITLINKEYLAVQRGFGPIEFICIDKKFPHRFSSHRLE